MGTKLWLAAVFVASVFLLALVSPAIGSVWSASREFNATQDSIFLNYTNGYSQNITLFSNASYAFALNVSNLSITITTNYSQAQSGLSKCINPAVYGGFFSVKNESDSVANQIDFSSLGQNRSINITLNMFDCAPGRYWGGFIIKNITNATENLTVSIDFHIPISKSAFNFENLPLT